MVKWDICRHQPEEYRNRSAQGGGPKDLGRVVDVGGGFVEEANVVSVFSTTVKRCSYGR